MSIQSKQHFLKSLEERFADVLTIRESETILGMITAELDRYDMELVAQDEPLGMDLLKAYLDAKVIEGRSAKTIERYRYTIVNLLETTKVPIRQITVFHLRGYLMRERERGVSDSTLEGMRSVFSAFFNWLQRESMIQLNPCANLGPIKSVKQVKGPYSDVDIERLKAACHTLRDKAIVCFLLTTGCRISEVVGLNREDVDLRTMRCKVLGKGNKERIAYFDTITALHLRTYLESRTDDHPALFVGKGTDRLKPGGVRLMLNEIAKRAGVDHVHPHRFRRTLATTLIAHGMPIQEVARILGHDKLDTTMGYVYLDDRDVQNSYRKYS